MVMIYQNHKFEVIFHYKVNYLDLYLDEQFLDYVNIQDPIYFFYI